MTNFYDKTIIAENQRVAVKHLQRLRFVANEPACLLLDQTLRSRGLGESSINLDGFNELMQRLKPLQPDITLRLFQHLTLSDFGLYGYACASAKTLRESIHRSIQFMALTTVRYQETEQFDGQWVKIYPLTAPSYVDQLVDIDEDFAAGNYRLLEVLLGGDIDSDIDWSQVTVDFSHTRPSYGAAYDDLFQCKIRFDQAETCIRYPVSWLEKPIRTNDPSLSEVCLARCMEIIVKNDGNSQWSDKVRKLIIESRFEVKTLEQAADELYLMPRTLREYLYREQLSFRGLLLELRMTLAQHYLQSTAMSGEQISFLLKYAQPSVFFRAFEKYFGFTTKTLRP